MKHRNWIAGGAGVLALAALVAAQNRDSNYRTSPVGYSDTPVLPGQKWKVHDIERPRPQLVTPGKEPGAPPSDAIVLFDGSDLSHWTTQGRPNRPAQTWKVENGYMEVVPGAGTLVSKEKFGDAQYHIEWSAPIEPSGDSQWRANSGILLMSRYEIQVLDSFNNPTYADGQAAAIYGQWPPMVNAMRKPGEWQVYDIVFEAPHFDGAKVVKPAIVTVFHNGVLMHHAQEIIGRMAHRVVGTYEPHAPEEPLGLQDHGVPVRFRNIWVRRIKGYDQQ